MEVFVRRIEITAIKANIVFREGALPRIDPGDPRFELDLGGVKIRGQVNAKAARKLAAHRGAAILQGRLVLEDGGLLLKDAGFTFHDPKPAAEPVPPSGLTTPPVGPPAGAPPPPGVGARPGAAPGPAAPATEDVYLTCRELPPRDISR